MKGITHGTYSGYVYHGCRCVACGLARKQYKPENMRVATPQGPRRNCLICGVALSEHPMKACWREVR